MSTQQKLIYGAVMALVVLFTAEILGVGTLAINIAFAFAMGLFAILAVTVASRIAGGGKK